MVLTKVNSWVFMRDSYWNTKGKKKKKNKFKGENIEVVKK